MSKYTVKKEFVTPDGELFKVGDVRIISSFQFGKWLDSLIENGFIEETNGNWRAVNGIEYFAVGVSDIGVYSFDEGGDYTDNKYYSSGNYFKSRETADKVSNVQKQLFAWLHDKDADRYTGLAGVMAEARDAVLEDDRPIS